MGKYLIATPPQARSDLDELKQISTKLDTFQSQLTTLVHTYHRVPLLYTNETQTEAEGPNWFDLCEERDELRAELDTLRT